MQYFVEEKGNVKKVYRIKIVKPEVLSLLTSKTAIKILKLLSKESLCAKDIARKLHLHEQIVYYHLRKFEKLKIIKLVRKEERSGGIAKIYSLAYPFLAIKIGERCIKTEKVTVPFHLREFFEDFFENGKFKCTIIISSPEPHGKYASQGFDGYAILDLMFLLGNLSQGSIKIKLDTQIKEEDLRDNLILVGGPKSNIIVDKINRNLPIRFDRKKEWDIFSSLSKKSYSEDYIGVIEKIKNPFNPEKQLVILAGKRFIGTRAAVIGLMKYPKEILKGNLFKRLVTAKVVKGIDKDSDGLIDDCLFLE